MKKGFTIIETLLVLSISALFAVGMLIGWNRNVDRARYEDAVSTFKSDIQAIFDEVSSPTNSRTQGSCIEETNTVRVDAAGQTGAGTTKCIIMGKIISFADNTMAASLMIPGNSVSPMNGKYVTWNLLGIDKDYSTYNDVISAIKGSKISVDMGSRSENTLEWGARLRMATDNRNDIFRSQDGPTPSFNVNNPFHKSVYGFAVVKSPLDGSVLVLGISDALYTGGFIHESVVLNQAHTSRILSSSKKIDICVMANRGGWDNGMFTYGRNKVVRVGPSTVEVAPLDGNNSISCGVHMDLEDTTVNGRPI